MQDEQLSDIAVLLFQLLITFAHCGFGENAPLSINLFLYLSLISHLLFLYWYANAIIVHFP